MRVESWLGTHKGLITMTQLQTNSTDTLNDREHAILRAVAAGRGKLLAGREPDLTVDGCWCDRIAVHTLVAGGLIRAAGPAAVGSLVKAVVTGAGHRRLLDRRLLSAS
jgi:hypothetical protein